MNPWLYFRSIMTSKCIAALLFAFRPGRDADRLALDSCTGWVRHIGYFPESGTYTFTLDTHLSKGTAEAALLDREKRQLMQLSPRRPGGELDLDAGNRYYIRWKLNGATGRCELRWRRQCGAEPESNTLEA